MRIPRASKFDLLEPIHDLVKVKYEVGAVRHEKSACAVEACEGSLGLNFQWNADRPTLRLQCIELLEERRDMDHDAVSNEPDALWVDESAG